MPILKQWIKQSDFCMLITLAALMLTSCASQKEAAITDAFVDKYSLAEMRATVEAQLPTGKSTLQDVERFLQAHGIKYWFSRDTGGNDIFANIRIEESDSLISLFLCPSAMRYDLAAFFDENDILVALVIATVVQKGAR